MTLPCNKKQYDVGKTGQKRNTLNSDSQFEYCQIVYLNYSLRIFLVPRAPLEFKTFRRGECENQKIV